MSAHFAIPCWGEHYANFLGRVTLPSLLAPGNLPFLVENCPLTVHFYLDEAASAELAKHKSFELLKSICTVKCYLVQEIVGSSTIKKYDQLIACHQHYLSQYGKSGNSLFFSNADYIWCDGAIARAYEGLVAGKRLICSGILRLNQHSLLKSLASYHIDQPILSLSPRTLVRIGLDLLHPEMLASFYNSTRLSAWSSILLWNVLHEGILMRTFHFQCIAVRPTIDIATIAGTIDCNLAGDLKIAPEDIEVVLDSDEICFFEATAPTDRTELLFSPEHFGKEVAGWISKHALGVHKVNAGTAFRYHHTSCSPKRWAEIERESALIVAELLNQAERLSPVEQSTLRGPGRLW